MIYAGFWILFGAVCALVAINKNRSWILWLIIGAVSGPFGLICIAIMDPIKLQTDEKSRSKSTIQVPTICPKCGKKYEYWAVQCQDCEIPLVSDPDAKAALESAKQETAEAAVEEEYKECPFCAETIKAKAIKCKHCGSMLEGSD